MTHRSQDELRKALLENCRSLQRITQLGLACRLQYDRAKKHADELVAEDLLQRIILGKGRDQVIYYKTTAKGLEELAKLEKSLSAGVGI